MYLGFLEYVEPIYSRFKNAEIPHVKKSLRQAYVEFCGKYDASQIMVSRLEAKVKRELAKAKKAPRLYVGYEAGCMYANELPEFVKICMSKPVYWSAHGHDYTIYTFSKPRTAEISEVFDRIARGLTINSHIICIYSDDSVWAGNVEGQVYAFNADVASCDSSVKSAGFSLSCAAMSRFDEERACGLVMQCKLPITLRSRDDRQRRIRIHRTRRSEPGVIVPIEGSGTVMTTMNNFMIMLMAAFVYVESGQFGSPAIRRAGLLCGLNLEVSDNFSETPEKLQFLKLSPILCTDGKYHLVRNYGCILRGLGKLDGDISPDQLGLCLDQFNKTNWNTRMFMFVSSTIASYCHEPQSEVMSSLRQRFSGPVITTESPNIEPDPTKLVVLEESMARRYDLDPQDLKCLANIIRSIKLGDIVVNDVLTRIYNVDYAL
jgi:hypothetical protein